MNFSRLDILFAALPLVVLIYLMAKRRSMRASRALPMAAALLYMVQLTWFAAPPDHVHAAVLDGLLTAATPIFIIAGAILLFKTMEISGAMATLRSWLNAISDNLVAQLMIVAWAFNFLIEGASGFGTPAAIAAPILVGLGVSPVRAAIVCLMMNTVPVSFGAVGTPIWFGFGELALTGDELQRIAIKTALMHATAAMIIPLLALGMVVEWRVIRRNLGFIYLSIFSCVIPYVLLASINNEFPAVAGGFIGLLTTIGLARAGIGLAARDQPVMPATPTDHPTLPIPTLIKALFPLWGTVLVLLATRIEQLGIKGMLTATEPAWQVPLGSLGVLRVSPVLVVQLRDIFHTGTNWSHSILYVPSLLPFGLIAVISFVLFHLDRPAVTRIGRETAERIREPIIALLGALAFVKLFMMGGDASAAAILGTSLAQITGSNWPYVATFLGALGSFFTGSNTISNLTFGPIQDTIAGELNLERTTMLALQSVGGAMGNMICIHNIVAVCSVLGLRQQEGFILRRTVLAVVVYGVVVTAVGIVLL